MSIFKNVDIIGSGSDLIQFLRTPRQHRWLLALLACSPPAIIVLLFNLDLKEVGKPGEPQVTYIESWPADRSVAEIVKSNIERQKVEDEQEAQMREAYKALGRATGMDVDRIEREANEARAKAAKEAAASPPPGAAK
jgi:hypothetical protein